MENAPAPTFLHRFLFSPFKRTSRPCSLSKAYEDEMFADQLAIFSKRPFDRLHGQAFHHRGHTKSLRWTAMDLPTGIFAILHGSGPRHPRQTYIPGPLSDCIERVSGARQHLCRFVAAGLYDGHEVETASSTAGVWRIDVSSCSYRKALL